MANEELPVKRQKAVALQYAEGDNAPHVVATGAGEIARRIIELAKEHNVPIKRDDSLVDILSRLDLGYEIPSETYHAIAEILAFLYRTDEAFRKRKEGMFQRIAPVAESSETLQLDSAEMLRMKQK